MLLRAGLAGCGDRLEAGAIRRPAWGFAKSAKILAEMGEEDAPRIQHKTACEIAGITNALAIQWFAKGVITFSARDGVTGKQLLELVLGAQLKTQLKPLKKLSVALRGVRQDLEQLDLSASQLGAWLLWDPAGGAMVIASEDEALRRAFVGRQVVGFQVGRLMRDALRRFADELAVADGNAALKAKLKVVRGGRPTAG